MLKETMRQLQLLPEPHPQKCESTIFTTAIIPLTVILRLAYRFTKILLQTNSIDLLLKKRRDLCSRNSSLIHWKSSLFSQLSLFWFCILQFNHRFHKYRHTGDKQQFYGAYLKHNHCNTIITWHSSFSYSSNILVHLKTNS